MNESTTSAEFFEKKYRDSEDPWDFAGSAYERFRYERIVASLDKLHYERVFEPGCSVGELTYRLASRCRHIEAMDISYSAVQRAQARCQNFSNVTFRVGSLPQKIPIGGFDLIMFSEIGYYFDHTGLTELATELIRRLRISGTFVAAHWLGISEDHSLTGDRVHEIVGRLAGLKLAHSERHEDFRLDRWVRV